MYSPVVILDRPYSQPYAAAASDVPALFASPGGNL